MKKKLLVIFLIFIIMFIIYIAYIKVSFNKLVNDTISYEDRINYNTNMVLNIESNITSSKIKYEVLKNSNIKKIMLSNYNDEKLENKILKYKVKKNKKIISYVYDNGKYIIQKNTKEDFNINYSYLKKSKLKSYINGEYKIKMKEKDAYNLIYNKNVLKENSNKYIIVTVKKDDTNNFIKEISYNIDNLNNSDINNTKLNYKVKIKNTNINNNDNIKLPF